MFKLLIVDDEKTTRDSLKEIIPWNKLGITTVNVAKNGLEALELAKQTPLDILLTDVRMPKMDGLALARHINILYPDCKIIFLSGYADKDYLKAAIHLKAINYIEKPINPAEISKIIQETVALCQAELQKNTAFIKLKNSVSGSKPLIRQEIALELIKGDCDVAKSIEKYGDLSFKLNADDYFTVAYIVFSWKANLEHNQMSFHKQLLLQMLSDDTLGNSAYFLAGFDSNENIVFITASKIATHPPDFKNIYEQLLQKFQEVSEGNYTFSIGVGSLATGLLQIPESYRSAIFAANRGFYFENSQIFYATQPVGNFTLKIDRNHFSCLKDFLEKDNQEAAIGLINKLTLELQIHGDNDINRVKNVYFHLLLVIFDAALERGLIDPFNDQEQNYIWHEIEAKKSLMELSSYVISSIRNIFDRLDEKDAVNHKIYEIMRHIRENYADKELSIQNIANHIYLSPTYLCAFFKKSTGKTLNEFITEVRIEKAKVLLKDSRMKLYEVATNVGFTDTNYFSTLFKKYVGHTPSEFREKYYR